MKVYLPVMIQDPRTSQLEGIKPVEGFHADREDFFLDGPVIRRLAVVDFDPETGEVVAGARFKPPAPGRKLGRYLSGDGEDLKNAKGDQLYEPAFLQVSVFAMVLRTVYMVERKATLGRPLAWGFDGPQLLVVPRAGLGRNAYYHRDSRSLQFFYFPSRRDATETIFTCLSRDIVAHETGHVIIDGIAPDLYDAITPQSLGIHEAIADLSALLMAFDSHTLRKFVLKRTGGSIAKPGIFSAIAEEFGEELRRKGGLRSLCNQRNLNPQDTRHSVDRYESHDLSQALSGALYSVMMNIHDDLWLEYAAKPENIDKPKYSTSGGALRKGAERFQRLVFRALDYLPPGEISYADYGRAIMTVDQVAYPDDPKIRNWVTAQFTERYLVLDEAALDVDTDFERQEPEAIDVRALHDSDWAAYQYANAHRDLLGIPEDIPFQLRPRLRVLKKYQGGEGEECILKVAWDHVEDSSLDSGYPRKRRITVGTTLAIDWKTGRILARLTNAPPERRLLPFGREYRLRRQEYEQQRHDRDVFVRGLATRGLLKLGSDALGPDGRPLRSVVQADVIGDAMKTRGTGKTLHIAQEDSHG